MNAESMGAHVIRAEGYQAFVAALQAARETTITTVIHVRNDRYVGVPGFAWWDVPPAEVSNSPDVRAKRVEWETQRKRERMH
jgi:3D-(3,5/4)-trihydroxycyclohexane-1,2-dione acylhydrolase (decyclizing)